MLHRIECRPQKSEQLLCHVHDIKRDTPCPSFCFWRLSDAPAPTHWGTTEIGLQGRRPYPAHQQIPSRQCICPHIAGPKKTMATSQEDRERSTSHIGAASLISGGTHAHMSCQAPKDCSAASSGGTSRSTNTHAASHKPAKLVHNVAPCCHHAQRRELQHSERTPQSPHHHQPV